MASRVASARAVLTKLGLALRDFNLSPSAFRIVHTINPTEHSPKTLYILDSSFNPPSVAHMSLATSALRWPDSKNPEPHRLLLLFSTHNADKAPSPASFEDRLAMMTLFAEDLQFEIQKTSKRTASHWSDISIDIGLTKAPYYTDKTAAITAAQPNPYPSNPTHVHLIGFDTVTRLLASKYYPAHKPPLSALSSYFEAGHKILVTIRPSDPKDASSAAFGTTDQQVKYLEGLVNGSLEGEGFKREWAGQISHLIGQEGIGVSSSRIRKAAQEQGWSELQKLCSPGVAEWVKEMGLYGQQPKTS
ncbi:uncharacterized protein IWZ02DRAFT_121908 [Phyllosticta citriasiana]|uniref:Nicotinamide-nucleotide adenylyltransferase n=1 Tax=Phyllosticta citriasiana TaxID=595635 RepID=A0ABR1KZU8_9PEZI